MKSEHKQKMSIITTAISPKINNLSQRMSCLGPKHFVLLSTPQSLIVKDKVFMMNKKAKLNKIILDHKRQEQDEIRNRNRKLILNDGLKQKQKQIATMSRSQNFANKTNLDDTTIIDSKKLKARILQIIGIDINNEQKKTISGFGTLHMKMKKMSRTYMHSRVVSLDKPRIQDTQQHEASLARIKNICELKLVRMPIYGSKIKPEKDKPSNFLEYFRIKNQIKIRQIKKSKTQYSQAHSLSMHNRVSNQFCPWEKSGDQQFQFILNSEL